MNPLLTDAAGSVSLVWIMAVMTVVFFLVFLGWVWYAWSPANRKLMDEAAQMPFADGGDA